jgi:hypothetical protein
MYWGLCTHLGTGVTQNGDATLIHYVTDGRLRPGQGSRGVGNAGRVGLHSDLADVVSLLCVRQAPDDPPSWLASSGHLHDVIAAEHPEYLPLLTRGFEWDRMDENHDSESPTTDYRVPFFSDHDGVLSCRYNRHWMSKAAHRLGRPFDDTANEMFDWIDQVNDRDRVEFPFHLGDIQFANNLTVLHGRASHEEVGDDDRKRLLMRIWFDLPDGRPSVDDAIVRYGVIRHGALGWTASQLAAGRHVSDHSRRADGAPDVHG